jgi:hypothetical protein
MYLPKIKQYVSVPATTGCPYWHRHPPNQPDEDPYCEYLDYIGEWTPEGVYPLLWDQCKECGVNEGNDNF